jgi:RNA polymerase sigma-70 factor (ECF subfamily)
MGRDIHLLIQGCKQGNQKSQLQVYRLYSEAMYFIACRYIQNEEEAKDIMQEGFLKAFQNMHKIENPNGFGAWLKKIIINQCLDFLRKKKLDTVSIEDPFVVQIIDDEKD